MAKYRKLVKSIFSIFPLLIGMALLMLAGCASESPSLPSYVRETGVPSPTASMGMLPPPYLAKGNQPGPAFPTPFPSGNFNTEEYERIVDNSFKKALDDPVSTFSIDVDTASYANVRRFLLEDGTLPQKDAVRIEELINYFSYAYPAPSGEHPVDTSFAMAPAPWAPDHWLLRVALKAKEIETEELPASNLVFLLDTSGSMSDENKLPLLKQSLEILVSRLRPQDRVSIVAYAGSTGLILDSTPGSKREKIINAFSSLQASGSTAGGAGILLAYDVAKHNYIKGGNNRVILCTDGDFNVGVSSTAELERLIEKKREDNIYLTVIGLGTGNYKDSRMETLADKGNGNYAYIDNLLEGKKVLGKEIWGTLFAVAKDVKIQIEFNPAAIGEYRLIGYENRMLAREDFNDDTKDAGEMGSGQTVTAFYEIVPKSALTTGVAPGSVSAPPSDPLVFQQSILLPSSDLLAFKLRYKIPGEDQEQSRLVSVILDEKALLSAPESNNDDFRFASAVVEFGLLLRESPYKGSASWKSVMERARTAKGSDAEGYRSEFVRLVEMAELIAERQMDDK